MLHRSTDEGVTWETISPDLTAREPQYQILPGNPITRDITGEEVYSSIYAMVESRLEKGVIWVGANDGPVQRLARQRQDVEERHAEGPRPGRPRADDRRLAASQGHGLRRRSTATCASTTSSRTSTRRTNYGESWTLLTDGKNGIPSDHPDARRPRGSRARGAALRRHRVRRVRVVQRRPQLAVAAAEPAGDAGHRHPACTATISSSRRWADRCGSWTTSRRCSSWRRWSAARGRRTIRRASGRSTTSDAVRSRRRRLQTMAGGRGALPPVHLFQPRDTIRYRHSASAGGNGEPEYPAPGVHIDLWFQAAPAGRREARDPRRQGPGRFAASASARAARGGGGQEMRGPVRGRAAPSGIRGEAGMQRFTWDMRLSRAVGAERAQRRRRRPDGRAGQVHRAAHGRRPDADAQLRAEGRSARDARRRHAGRSRRAGRVSAQGARRDQRRAAAAAARSKRR